MNIQPHHHYTARTARNTPHTPSAFPRATSHTPYYTYPCPQNQMKLIVLRNIQLPEIILLAIASSVLKFPLSNDIHNLIHMSFFTLLALLVHVQRNNTQN